MPLPKTLHPVFKAIVPSTGDSIWMRPYLVKEQKIIQTLAESEDPVEVTRNLKNLVAACITSPENFDTDKLTVYDIQWLVIKLREVSVGNEVEQTYVCKNKVNKITCNNDIVVKFKLSDIQYIKPENTEFPNNIVPINDKLGVRLFYPRIHDDTINMIGNAPDTENMIQLVARDIDYIYDENGTYSEFTVEEAVEFLRGLKIDEFKRLMKFYREENLPKLKIDVPYKCGKCQAEGTISLTSLFDFFSF